MIQKRCGDAEIYLQYILASSCVAIPMGGLATFKCLPIGRFILISYVVRPDEFCNHLPSIAGRNIYFCCMRYGCRTHENVLLSSFLITRLIIVSQVVIYINKVVCYELLIKVKLLFLYLCRKRTYIV